MTDNKENNTEVNKDNASELSDADHDKMMHAIASDMIQNTNIVQAFEIVREKAIDFARGHIQGLTDDQKVDLLQKIEDQEKKMLEQQEKAKESTAKNPEEGAVVGG